MGAVKEKRLTTVLAGLALLAAAMLAAMVSGLGNSANAQSGDSLPASKATIAINELVGLTQVHAPGGADTTTGWVEIMSSQIKTSNKKDLMFDVAIQCGLITDTTVSSKSGLLSSASASSAVDVRALVDGVPAKPDNGQTLTGDGTKATTDGVTYCNRFQKLEARFSGYNCTANTATGVVTCADPETLRLLLKTLSANSFNFAKKDVSSGVHTVTVEARATADARIIDDPVGGTLAGAEAFVGAGSMYVEEVRLINQDVDGVNEVVEID